MVARPWSAGAQSAPFDATANAGPEASSHVDATVTRSVAGKSVTLPAALVPALAAGDVVDVDFTDYRRPPASVNFHTNVAFVTETAPQHWLFERSGPQDRLFIGARAKPGTPPTGHIHFTYGAGTQRGIPIFFVVPEDGKTRGLDGVRDYVEAHPTDFIDMSQSANDAVDRYSFFRDFLSAIGSGSIDPATSRSRIESAAQALGVSPSSVDVCYTTYTAAADIDNCIQQTINGVVYQPNFNAPTQGQFFGGVAGAAVPLAYAAYIAPLITIWRIFVHTGHQEYEYLPTTLGLAGGTEPARNEMLRGLKVPTLRPPGAYSDALFFTIGDPQAAAQPPAVVNDGDANGICPREGRFDLPLHLDRTSEYLHDTALAVTADGGAPTAIPLSPQSLAAPVIDRAALTGRPGAAFTVALTGRYGFDPIHQPARDSLRVAFPSPVAWSMATMPHRQPIAGGAIDVIAASSQAPCLSRAELTAGNAAPVPLTVTHLDAGRVALHGSLAGVPAGPVDVRLYQDDPLHAREIENDVSVDVQFAPAHVDPKSASAAIGDGFIALSGTDLESARAVRVAGATYVKAAPATSTAACFVGPPLSGTGVTFGQQLSAQIITPGGGAGEVFPLTAAPPRPALEPLTSAGSTTVHLSTDVTPLLLQSRAALPRAPSVRIRRAADAPAPCDAVRADPTGAAVPDANVHVRSATSAQIDLRASVLGDRAFGALQLQLLDAATGSASAWMPIPGLFARAPEIAQIACSATPTERCRLSGGELAAIDAVRTTDGTFVPPDPNCPPSDKGVACVYVPHLAHYTLRLVDAATIEEVSDSLIVTAPAPAARS